MIFTYGVKEDNAIKLAQVFVDNLKDFELLDSRGVLTSALPAKPIVAVVEPEAEKHDNTQDEIKDSADRLRQNPPPAVIPQNEYINKYQNHIWIPIHITKNETAVFAYPKDITENDIKIVEHQLAGILLRIRLENEEKKNKGAETTPS